MVKTILPSPIKYCTRCCMPETQEGISFDELGICKACQSSEEKMHINWKKRKNDLEKVLAEAKKNAGNNYDCILPISGGKDSFYQAHILCKVYGMKPLAVTFSHNWFSETGWYNLQRCLEVFNLDHIMFTPNRELVNKLARHSLEMIGDTCWTCHAGVGAFPLQIACKFHIPLLVYGESIAESSGRASYFDPVRKYNREYFTKVSAKVEPKDMICGYLKEKDLYPFNIPSIEECEASGVYGIHLGDYIFWDEEKQTEFVMKEYGWKETDLEGAFKGYKGVECVMTGMHDFTCYLKRGYGRATFQACVDIRKGLLTRDEGIKIANEIDTEIPESLDYYLENTGMTKEEFYQIMKNIRHEKIKEIDLPVKEKKNKCKENRKPFSQQLIDKHINMKDTRLL